MARTKRRAEKWCRDIRVEAERDYQARCDRRGIPLRRVSRSPDINTQRGLAKFVVRYHSDAGTPPRIHKLVPAREVRRANNQKTRYAAAHPDVDDIMFQDKPKRLHWVAFLN